MRIGLDLDGTLISCRERQMTLLGLLAKACRLVLDVPACWSLKREGLSNRAALVCMGASPDQAERVAGLWEQGIEDFHWLRYDQLLPDVPERLRYWREAGHSLHLISARRNPVSAAMQLRYLGLGDFASLDFVDPFVANSKRQALERVRPDVYIGDTERGNYVILQEYVEGAELGDIRILMLNGKPIGAMRRIPPADDVRSNVHAGGSVVKHQLTEQEKRLCAHIGPKLVRDGLFFAGIDVINGKLIEVNVMSPGGIARINRLNSVRLQEKVIDFIEHMVSKKTQLSPRKQVFRPLLSEAETVI